MVLRQLFKTNFTWSCAKIMIDISEMGSVVNCEMLHRTNLIAIVGGGSRPKFADNSILIYDDVLKEFVLDYTFTSPVVAVRLKRDRQDLTLTFLENFILKYTVNPSISPLDYNLILFSNFPDWLLFWGNKFMFSHSRTIPKNCSRWKQETTPMDCVRSIHWCPVKNSWWSALVTN